VIPPVAHLIWYGTDFPWVNALAIRSLLSRGALDRVVLHHDADLTGTRWWSDLADPRFEAWRIDAPAIFARSGGDADALAAIYEEMPTPASRANVLRAAILAAEGGVYLDMDTVTVRPLPPLLATGFFCGEERVVYPAAVARSRSPGARLPALGRIVARDVLRRLPGGWRTFRRIEASYPLAANNAVVGAAPCHPLVRRLLDEMVAMPREKRLVRFALGTHLLQDVLAAHAGGDLVVYPPSVFYPLAPEISEHWFRRTRKPDLARAICAETRVVHWYASVRTRKVVPLIDPDYVKRHAARQLFSALALPFAERW